MDTKAESHNPETWIATWRPQTPSDTDSNQIAIPQADAECLLELLRHYKDLIVFLGYSMWRKLIIMCSTGFTPDGPRADLQILRETFPLDKWHPASATAGQLAIAGCERVAALKIFNLDSVQGPETRLSELSRKLVAWFILQGQVDVVAALAASFRLTFVMHFMWVPETMSNALHLAAGGTSMAMLHFIISRLELPTGNLTQQSFLRDADDHRGTPLGWAVRNCPRIVERLIELGADITEFEFHIACCQQTGGMIRLLLGLASPEQRSMLLSSPCHGFTPLVTAATEGSVEATRALLEQGADIDAGVEDGECALNFALGTRGGFLVTQLLLERGARINFEQARGAAIQAAQDGELDNIRLLAEHSVAHGHVGSLLDFATCADTVMLVGFTPLHYAARFGSTKLLRFFVEECGAPVDMRDASGLTSLHYAAANAFRDEHVEVAKFLLASGLDSNCRNHEGQTVLHFIAHPHGGVRLTGSKLQKFMGRFVNVLLAAETIDLHAKDNKGQTVLDIAVNHGLITRVREKLNAPGKEKARQGRKKKEEKEDK